MKTVKAEVKSAQKNSEGKRVTVAEINYPEYETLDEAIKALSEPTCLKLVNAQVATNEKNRARADAVGTPSEKALQQEAFARIVANADLTKKFMEVTGDQTRTTAFLAEIVAQIKAEKGIVDEAGTDAA
jgi:hypothetical protein